MTKIKIKKRYAGFSGIILLIGIIFIGTALSSVMAELVNIRLQSTLAVGQRSEIDFLW